MSRIDNEDFSEHATFSDEAICQAATLADLDMEQVETFLQGDRVQRQDEYRAGYTVQQQMEAFGLARGEHPSYGALLCFGRNPSHSIPGAYTRCTYTSHSGHLEGKEYRVGLLKQFAEAQEFLQKRLNFGRMIERGGSSEQPEFPFGVLEEALANALIHREYVTGPDHIPNTEEVRVEISRDRVKISNPIGPFPRKHRTNPQIIRIFYLAGHAERAGTGVTRMVMWMQEANLPKPEIEQDEARQTFSIILPRQVLIEPDPEASDQKELALIHAREGMNNPTLQVGTSIALGGSSQSHYLIWTVLSIILSVALVFGVGVGAFTVFPQLYRSAFVPLTTTIEIASELPISGVDTVIGLPVQNGVQMAIDDANNRHLLPGYTLKLTPYDDVGRGNRHDPLKGAINLKTAIVDNLVAGIIGPYNSAVAVAELPIANQTAIALISPSNTYPCLTKDVNADPDCSGSSNIKAQMRPTGQLTYFRLSTTDDQEGKAAADYFARQHYRKVLLLKDDSDVYSSGLAQVFQKEWEQQGGVAISLEVSENASTIQDYQRALQAAASLQPDLVYFSGNDPYGTYALKALSNIPQLRSVAFAGGDGIVDSSFLQTAAQLHRSTPIYATLSIQDPAHSGPTEGTHFEQNYKTRGYTDYRPTTASAYDSTMMLIQAIKIALQQKGISTPHGEQDQVGARQFRQAILHALAQLHYTGATGEQSFDANGDTTNHTISFYQPDLSNSQPDWRWLQQVNA